MAEVREIKVTKRMKFEEIATIMEAQGREDLAEAMRHEIELLDNKNEKAKARKAKAKAEGDELREAVQAVLTDELQTINQIAGQIEGEDITNAKITARLTQLVKAGIATKEQVKVEGASRKVMAYKLNDEPVAEDAEDEVEE